MKIGDKVRINKEYLLKLNNGELPFWYTDNIYIIRRILESDIVSLNKELPNAGDSIYIDYLTNITEQRINKLLKLKNIS